MATATKQPAPEQPGSEKPAPDKSVGIAEVAEHLGTDPRSLRAFLRRTNQAVGRGTSYSWPSLNDSSVERLRVDWDATKAEKSERPSTKK